MKNSVCPENTSCQVEVRTSNEYGRVLYSTANFVAGNVVFVEDPILLSLLTLSEEEEVTLNDFSESTGLSLIEDFLFLKSFCSASDRTRTDVLDCFSPSSCDLGRSELLKAILRVVELCRMFAWSDGFSDQTLETVVLVKACNAHGFFAHNSHTAALYSKGSKARHSCCPNVVYTSQRVNGRGSFIAKTDIKTGDELFISYIATFRSVPMRQSLLLKNYLFECKCRLCTEDLDSFRGLLCECSGTLFRYQSTGLWGCSNCVRTFSDDTKPLSDDEEDKFVREMYRVLDSYQVDSRTQMSCALERAYSKLGPKHAMTKLLEKAFLSHHLLISYMVVDCHVDQIVHLTDSILEWCNYDPDFLDSTLVEIACAIGRCGNFEKALFYLDIVLRDMEFLFGVDASENEHMKLVKRAMEACRRRYADAVPDLIGGINM
jgi:hypothetical protein